MKIQILCDNLDSWMVPYASEIKEHLINLGHEVFFIQNSLLVEQGDILVLLSCERIFKKLQLNKHNLVVHESDLPKGKGWSPLTWQILEGKKNIKVTLFEADARVDAGKIYNQVCITLNGDELIDEIRKKQAEATKELIINFIKSYPHVEGQAQQGEETFYRRRTPEDSQLDPDKTIAQQFNLFQVADNDRYPAFFVMFGHKYIVRIEKAKPEK